MASYGGRPPGMRKWQRATLEHVQAQTHGGSDSLWNLTMSCSGCNSARGSMFEAEEFFEIMQQGDTFEDRRRFYVAARDARKRKKAEARQANQNAFMLKLAVLFGHVPGLCEYYVGALEQERAQYLALRAEYLARQQAQQVAA